MFGDQRPMRIGRKPTEAEKAIAARPCDKCGQPIGQNADFFFRSLTGKAVFHTVCKATSKGPVHALNAIASAAQA